VDYSKRAAAVVERLHAEYSSTAPLLTFENPYQLLIAVVLSAQTTDAQVNKVTPKLFQRYPTPHALAQADVEQVAAIVRSTGFYKTKAKNIRACAAALVERHDAVVPRTMEDLTALPGVGRKTASVILAVIYQEPAIIVDTHFSRVARRLELTDEKTPERIERQVAERVERSLWSELSMLLNRHGRRYCTARSPRCGDCPIASLCPFPVSEGEGTVS
jgi:endonuclease-3